MNPQRKSVFITVLFLTCVLLAGCGSGAAQTQNQSRQTSKSQVPGPQLKPGHYTLQNLSLSPATLSLKVGATLQMVAAGLGSDNQTHTVTDHISWTSSAPAVATVVNGLVTAIAPGTATITAQRGPSATSTVTVTNNTVPLPPVPSSLFSMTTHARVDWPTDTIFAIRLWGTGTYWGDINTANGVYDFTTLDKWIATAQTEGTDIIYTFGETPTWASSNPSMVCGSAGVPLGSCMPANDVNSDGTGTDQIWKNFVTAIVTHSAGQIKYWEMWNEPTVPGYWQGNNAQMLRMAQDAYGIIKAIQPTAQVTTPSPSTGVYGVSNWMGPYLALGGGQYADIITFHSYSWKSTPGVYPQPEDIVPLVENLKAVLVPYGQDKKPLWSTEGSWGDTSGNGFTDPDMHAAYLGRHYLLQESENVQRYYWFAWDNGGDGLWDYTTGVVSEAGIAYQQVQNWMVGANPTGQCAASGTTWTCAYTRTGNFQAEAIWDTSQSCSNGVCTTTQVTVPSVYTKYLDLAGGSHTITNHSVPVGAKPIWLQNQ